MSDKAALKAFFETGDVPTQTEYGELIDSNVNTDETTDQSIVSKLTSSKQIKAIGGFGGLVAFSESIKADTQGYFPDYTQAGELNLTKDVSVVDNEGYGNGVSGLIISDGSSINITFDFVMKLDSLISGDIYQLWAVWNGSRFTGGAVNMGTPPSIISASVDGINPNDLVIVFNEVVNATNIGYTFRVDSIDRALSSVAGSGTGTLTFTISGDAIETGEVLDISYDILTGDTASDTTSLKLQSVTQQSVTNIPAVVLYLTDDFTGITIDTAKWDVINGNPSSVVISQNNELLLTPQNVANTSYTEDTVESDDSWATNVVMSFDLKVGNQINAAIWSCGLWKDNLNTDRIYIIRDETAGTIAAGVRINNVNELIIADYTLDISTAKRMKIIVDGSDISLYHLDGATWEEVGSDSVANSVNWKCFFGQGDSTSDINVNQTIDRVRVTDVDDDDIHKI